MGSAAAAHLWSVWSLAAEASAGARSIHDLKFGNFAPPLFDLYTYRGGGA